MKIYIYTFTLVVSLFCIVFIFISTRSKNVTDLDNAFLQKPVPQKIQNRIWKEMKFNKIGISEEFISSLHMRIDQNNFIYIADNNSKVIKQYNTNGKLVNVFGNGEGKGPGEFLIIFDILIDRSGRLWALDDRNNRVIIFNTENEEDWEILNFAEAFNRITPVNNDTYWLENKYNNQMKEYLFADKFVKDIETTTENPELWSYVLESYSALIPDGGILQSQYHTNMFLKYSEEGKIIYFREPIEFQGLPKINPYYANEVGRMNTVDFSTWQQITRNPQIVDNTIQLFVHKKINNSDEWYPGFIDVYDIENGNYLYSYKLPDDLESLAISENYIAGISTDLGKLIIWKLN